MKLGGHYPPTDTSLKRKVPKYRIMIHASRLDIDTNTLISTPDWL